MTENLNKLNKKEVAIWESGKYFKIDLDELSYLKSDGNYVYIITSNSKIIIKKSLKQTLLHFDNEDVFRTHKSFAINLKKIKSASNHEIILDTNETIPIGRKYKKELFEKLPK